MSRILGDMKKLYRSVLKAFTKFIRKQLSRFCKFATWPMFPVNFENF